MFCESALVPVRLDAATGRVPLLVRFSYNGRDPYAVQAAFFDGPYLLARWRFDRQMLAEGLQRPVGEGDVAFRPHTRAGVGELRMDLRGQGVSEKRKPFFSWMPTRSRSSCSRPTRSSARAQSSWISTSSSTSSWPGRGGTCPGFAARAQPGAGRAGVGGADDQPTDVALVIRSSSPGSPPSAQARRWRSAGCPPAGAGGRGR